MSNFRHYLEQIRNGNSFFTIKRIYMVTLNAFSLLHLIVAAMFLCAGGYLMMTIHFLMGFFVFTVIRPLSDKENYILALIIMTLELAALVFVTTLCIGLDGSFTNYLFAGCTVVFYYAYAINDKKHLTLPLLLTLFLLLSHYICYALTRYIDPIFPIAENRAVWLRLFYVFNTLVSFSIMVLFSYLFIWEIRNKERVLAEQNEKLDEMAHKDPLTHLYNRRSMTEYMNERMDLLKRTGKRFTMILGDIDDFKKVNDTYGHDAGDIVLTTVASTIMNVVGENGRVCRWGGEEILILVQDPLEKAALTAEKIRHEIEGKEVISPDKQLIRITMTFGIAESVPGYRIEHLIQQADDKLYYGKKHGKNQVVSKLN